MLGHQPDRLQLAHASLAGAHRHGRVALGQLDRVIALVDRESDVLAGHVLAEAGEALAAARAGDRRCNRDRLGLGGRGLLERPHPRGRLLVAEAELGRGAQARQLTRARDRFVPGHPGHLAGGEHAGGQVGEREVTVTLVVLGPRAGLQQQRRRRHRTAGHQHQVAVELVLGARDRRVQRADHGRVDALAPARLDDRVVGEHRQPLLAQLAAERGCLGPQVADRHDLDTEVAQRRRGDQAAVRRGARPRRACPASPRRSARVAARRPRASRRAGRCRRTPAAVRSCRSRTGDARPAPGAACRPARPVPARRSSQARSRPRGSRRRRHARPRAADSGQTTCPPGPRRRAPRRHRPGPRRSRRRGPRSRRRRR